MDLVLTEPIWKKITQIERTDYLSANSQVVQDNNLWLSTSQGVLQYDLDQTKITLKNTIGTEYGGPLGKYAYDTSSGEMRFGLERITDL